MSWPNDSRPFRDEEYPEPDADDETYDTFPCPECGASIFEDADQCPYCSAYVSLPHRSRFGHTVIWIGLTLLALACLVTVFNMLFR